MTWTDKERSLTFLVKLLTELVAFAKAEAVILPRMTLLTELMKLDLPAPTGPYRRTRR